MKNLKFLSLFVFTISLFMLTSCETDPCETVSCLNDGICNEGTCDCPDGYQGTTCEIEWRTKMLGDFTVNQACTWANFGPFDCTITKDATNALGVDYDGFEGSSEVHFDMVMTGETTFDIPRQSGCSGCPELSGNGSINATTNVVEFTFEFDSGASCTYTLDPK